MTSSQAPARAGSATDARPGELEYHELHRAGRRGVWRPLAGVAALAVLFVIVVPLIVLTGFDVGLAATGTARGVLDGDPVTPTYLAYLNLSLAGAIPAAILVSWAFHGQRPGWLVSVVGRIRWRWFAACLGIALIALLATLVVSALVPAQAAEGAELSTDPNAWTSTVRDFVIIIVLLTPLQAAGEEYAFRGYLTQAFGGLVRSRWVAVVVPALLFALAHGIGQDVPIFFDRFAFGLVSGVLVILTGGLEAGIAMHVLNNFLAYGLALAFSDMTSALNPTGGSWWSIPVTLTQSLVFLGLALLTARRMGVRTTVDPAVLAAPRGRV